jgi:hypothetical protein
MRTSNAQRISKHGMRDTECRAPLREAARPAMRFNASTLQRFNALVGLLLLFLAANVFGQSYSINWYNIAGGGGTSTNGQYFMSGTIGQPDASGPMTGGNYSVTGGFWALISVVQTAGAPALYISHSGTAVTVHWHNVPGWTLQQTSSLNPPVTWTPNSSWTTSNGTNYLNITSPTGRLFFRLQGP